MAITVEDLIKVPFLNRTQEDKLRIIQEGKPRPDLTMPAAVRMNTKSEGGNGELETYRFHVSMYDATPWLTGCDKRNTLFCWPCLLFMPTVGLWNTTGILNIFYLLEQKKEHERSFEHLQATLKLNEMLELHTKAPGMDLSEHNEMVKRNRAILKRLTDVVCNLLTKEQPIYERINGCELDPENCIKNLKFLRTYDVLNCNYIEDAVDLIQISPDIVNDIVDTIARGLKMAFRKEIHQSTYVSIILTDHTKIAENSQISTVLRYLKGSKVCERFVGYYNMGSLKTTSTVYGHIINVLNEFALAERFLGISIGGGVLEPPEIAELTSMLKNMYPFIFFTPCYGHSLEYILQQSLANMKGCDAFFKAMNEMKNFFPKKSKQFKALVNFMAAEVAEIEDTKWFVRSQFIQVVNKYRKYFIHFFNNILWNPMIWNADDISKSMGFTQILEDFRTMFFLQTFTKLFEYTSALNKIFKSSSPEKCFTGPEVSTLIENLIIARDKGFEDLWTDMQMNHFSKRPSPASKKIKIDFEDPRVVEYRDLYDTIIDRMLQEIEIRFSSLNRLSFCQLLSCDKFGQFTFKYDMIETLISVHGAFFDEEQIKNELIILRTNGTVFGKKSAHAILDFFIQTKLKSSFKYLYKLAEFILTLPIKPRSEDGSKITFKDISKWSYIPVAVGVQHGDISIPCVELEYLQELKKSNTFHDEIAVIFYDHHKTFELIPR